MRIGNKGQGAMEYLMTYGWAILVVMIVGVVLWQLGVFGGGPGAANTATGFAKIKPLPASIKYDDSDNTLNFTLVNGAGTPITIAASGITITGGDHDCGTTTWPAAAVTVGTGDTINVGFSACTKAAGASFSADIEITYTQTVAGTSVTHTDSGTIRGAVEA